jgi:DnaK suppressor protein
MKSRTNSKVKAASPRSALSGKSARAEPESYGVKPASLDSIRNLLLTRREELAQDLRQSTRDFIDEDPSHTDALDQAAADVDRSFSLQLKNRGRDTLVQIDEALRRMETGVFGQCERCEEEIAEARIHAFPFTTLCVECKGELEIEQRRTTARE